jgi:hypothetical protein
LTFDKKKRIMQENMHENYKIAVAITTAKPIVPSKLTLPNQQQKQVSYLKNYSKVRDSIDPLCGLVKRAATSGGA